MFAEPKLNSYHCQVSKVWKFADVTDVKFLVFTEVHRICCSCIATRSTRPIDAKLWKKFMSLRCSKTFDIFDFKFGVGTYSHSFQSRCIASKNDYKINVTFMSFVIWVICL